MENNNNLTAVDQKFFNKVLDLIEDMDLEDELPEEVQEKIYMYKEMNNYD